MADALGKATETASGLTKTATDTAGGLAKTAMDTAGGAAQQAGGAAGSLTKRRKKKVLEGPYGPGELVGGTGMQSVKAGSHRIVPVKQSRIADRPPGYTTADSNIKIKIELDLEVEVEIYARVKGDVMIGLM